MIQVRENPSIIISGPLPGIRAVIKIAGVSGCKLQKVKEMLESTDEFLGAHGGDSTL